MTPKTLLPLLRTQLQTSEEAIKRHAERLGNGMPVADHLKLYAGEMIRQETIVAEFDVIISYILSVDPSQQNLIDYIEGYIYALSNRIENDVEHTSNPLSAIFDLEKKKALKNVRGVFKEHLSMLQSKDFVMK